VAIIVAVLLAAYVKDRLRASPSTTHPQTRDLRERLGVNNTADR
jgi:hypothetical protein